jgi:hypothetical protein
MARRSCCSFDNSASPPLDPEVQRREAIEKITPLEGQPYRLIFFGG